MLAVLLPQLTVLLPSVSGANMASAVVLVSLAEGAWVPPVVGVSEGLPPVTLGVGVGPVVVVSLGVADGVAEALADGVADGLGVGVGVQATAGVASVDFFLDAAAGRLVLTPIGTVHGPGLARPAADAGTCC